MAKFDAIKKTEKILSEYRAVNQNILNLKTLKKEVEEYKTRGIKCIDYSSIGGGSYIADTVGKNVVMVDEMERIVQRKIDSESKVVKYVDMSMNTLRDYERKVIELKYFEDASIEEICDKMYRSESWVHKTRKKALSQLAICLFGTPSELLKISCR